MNNFREVLARLAFPLVMGLGLIITYYFIQIKGVSINKVTFPIVFYRFASNCFFRKNYSFSSKLE